MDEQERINNFGNQLTFTSLSYLLKNNILPVNENAKARIRKAEDFFVEIADALENITNNKGKYIPVQNLKKILEFAGYSTSNMGMAAGLQEFKRYAESMRAFDKNPRRFYSEEDYKRGRLLKICEAMKTLYDRITYEEKLAIEKEEEADY